ncbi:SGNH/GDSL hydrolase family protein [Rossellomorea vietnamensis]|uniref:SGNH/GDSL hydrolase family protein n=1 Tax=Rossellomorea vietnamensis TaxID=218284 RepID=UPI001E342A11|nr:SGNH/GDSL hydrolase family protein [Rossellomorea vietnamensis]MCC5803200.1 SGNH/GDSL hydrolase family protein [Rossellomorea vietnamensis]
MKTFSLFILAIGCAAVLFYGNMTWQEKTSSSSPPHPAKVEETGTEPDGEETADDKALIAHWPEKAQDTFLQDLKAKKPYKLALVGSTALGEEENGWSRQVKEELESTYGASLDVTIYEYDSTSIEFVNGEQAEEVLTDNPDLVLLEPFSLSDNSNLVGSKNNHESIQIFNRRLTEQNEDAVLILQPTHPIAGATYYPEQIEELQAFAEEQNIPYLDHWTAWPEDDETLADYVTENQEAPNEKGHVVWADYLLDYFIAE